MKFLTGIPGMALTLVLCIPMTYAQTEAKAEKQPETLQTFYLSNVSAHDEVVEILTALRNMLTPACKVYLVPSQNAILLNATPDQIALARKILADLDRPRKTYRLTYTISELDSGKLIGTQHFAMIVVSGQRTRINQVSKVPVGNGSPINTMQTQFSYHDVGLKLDATLDESTNGVRLFTKAEQSSVALQPLDTNVRQPIIRETDLEGTSILTPGKPAVLGSLDVPGSTRHFDISVVMEVVH